MKDDENLSPELREIQAHLDRELGLDVEEPAEEPPIREQPTRRRDFRRFVSHALLALTSSFAVGSAATLIAHRCPTASSADGRSSSLADAGALDAGEGAASEESEENEADEPESECPAAKTPEERASESVWVRAHLELRAVQDENASASLADPIAWRIALPERLEALFPAVSRDGRAVVQLYRDVEGLGDDITDSITVFSVAAGTPAKRVATFELDSTLARRGGSDGTLTPARLLALRERDRMAANRILDATEWRHLPTARRPQGVCLGTPWEKLDEERTQRDEWSWDRVARLDDEGIDLEYDREQKQITVRMLRDDGTFATSVVPSGLFEPCGHRPWQLGEVFGSRSLGMLFLLGEEFMLPCPVGGNGCPLPSDAERTSTLRLPKSPH